MPDDLNPAFDAPFPRAPKRINPLSVASPEIVEFIERLKPRAIGNWNEVGAEEYARSFVAAQTAGTDVINDLYAGLVATVREQGNRTDYQNAVIPVLRAKGWLPELNDDELADRVGLIYDTNIRVARSVGLWQGFQRSKALVPYLRWQSVHDARTRHSHYALDGIIRPVDDPLWQECFPPAGFRCRCVISGLTRSVAARKGGPSSDQQVDEALAVVRADSTFWRNRGLALAPQLQSLMDARADAPNPIGARPVNINAAVHAGAVAWGAAIGQGLAALINRLRGDATS